MKIDDILDNSIGLIDTDKKRLQICNEPSQIFQLGYNMFYIEKYFTSKRLVIEEIKGLIVEEDYYKIYQKIIILRDYYYDQRGRYAF